MSKTLSTLRTKLDEIIGDTVSGTTSSAGDDVDYTTAVDASLARYPDDWFKDKYLYMIVALEERMVKTFLSPEGTLTVWEAFTAQVATAKAYKLSRFCIADKMVHLNRALVDSYPYFYNRITGVLLGQGSEDREYLISDIIGDTFSDIPEQLYVQEAYTGTHTTTTGATLTDSNADWDDDELIGHIVYNKTDGSYGTITDNDSTTVTATLAGGTDDEWGEDDEYLIAKNLMPDRTLAFKVITGDNAKFYANVKDTELILCVGQSQLTAFVAAKGGSATATTSLHLIDTTKNQFVAADVGRKVWNSTDDTYAYITAYTSTSDVTLDTNIMASGEDYTIDATTELDTDEQAEIVALKGAANLYKAVLATIDSSEVADFRALADKWEWDFWYRITHKFMPSLVNRIPIDWSWAE